MQLLFRQDRQSGVTLIELMVTLTLAAILVSVAVPSFQSLVQRNRIAGNINALVAHLQLARSTAVMRGQRAVLCPTLNGADCQATNVWDAGWMIFMDINADRVRDVNEVILAHHGPLDAITVRSGSRRTTITYQATGFAGGSNTTFEICDKTGAAPPRAVIVSNTGRPRMSDKGPGGRAIQCP